jgi:toxin YoeB
VKLIFHKRAWRDYFYWQATDAKMLARINLLITDISRTPFQGIGKPEPLRGDLREWWSRRIESERRLAYRPGEHGLLIAKCRFHS